MLTECDVVDLDAVPRQREGLACRPLDDEAVLYDPAHHILHYLNRTAHLIWTHCDGHRNVGQIARSVADAFDLNDGQRTPSDAVLDDVRRTLTDLADNGLIDLHSPHSHDASCRHPCPT